MDQYQRRSRSHIFYLAHFYLAFFGSFEYRVIYRARGLAVRYLGYGKGLVVDLLDFGAYLHRAAALAVIVFAYIKEASCREVGIQHKRLSAQISHSSIYDFVKIMRQYLRRQTYGYTLGPLHKQQRKLNRQRDRLRIAAVI